MKNKTTVKGYKKYFRQTGILFEKVGYKDSTTGKDTIVKLVWRFQKNAKQKALDWAKIFTISSSKTHYVPVKKRRNFDKGSQYLILKSSRNKKGIFIRVKDKYGITRTVHPLFEEIR